MSIYGVILIAWLALGAGFNVSKDYTLSGVLASLIKLAIMTWLIFKI